MTLYLAITCICIIAALSLGFASLPFKTTRKRRQQDPSNRGNPPDLAAVLTVVATKLRVTLPTEFSQNGTPHWGITGGAHVGTEYPTAITLISPLVFDLTYANIVAITTNTVTIPSQDPAIRFRNGAYVQPQIKVLA
jgi:hypothetical protein